MKRPVLMSVVQYQKAMEAGDVTVFALIDKLDELGVDGIELRPTVWANYEDEIAEARQRIEAAGKIATYATFSTLFADDEGDQMRHDLDMAEALGSPLLRVFPGAIPEHEDDPAWEVARELVEDAAAYGVVIALENFGREPGGTSAEVLRVLKAIPKLKTNIDIGNYTTHGEDVVAVIQSLGDRAVYAHLKDKSGEKSDATTALGTGSMPLDTIMAVLNALPQELIYCFEFSGGGEPEARIKKSLAYLRGV